MYRVWNEDRAEYIAEVATMNEAKTAAGFARLNHDITIEHANPDGTYSIYDRTGNFLETVNELEPGD